MEETNYPKSNKQLRYQTIKKNRNHDRTISHFNTHVLLHGICIVKT